MAFDQMEWHAETFPDSMDRDCAGTHIGMYLAWLIMNDMIAPELYREYEADFERVKRREMTGRDLLMERLNEGLLEDVMTEEAQEFTADYYDSKYIDDYENVLGNSADSEYAVYLHDDSWENYDQVEPMITERFEQWRDGEWD
ncbi:MAG: hypothetical protein VB082_09235 [Christensenella sp.]|nr:hypothetical protein [Christensenella sp.]